LLLTLRLQLTVLRKFWQGADTIGLCFWIICNAVQFRVFNRAELSSLNWLLNWHTLPLSLLAAVQLMAVVNVSQTLRLSKAFKPSQHIGNQCMHVSAQ
jgi:hypothetical protein